MRAKDLTEAGRSRIGELLKHPQDRYAEHITLKGYSPYFSPASRG